MDYNARKITRHLQRRYATSVEQPLSWEIIDAFCALQDVNDRSRRAAQKATRTSGDGDTVANNDHPTADASSERENTPR